MVTVQFSSLEKVEGRSCIGSLVDVNGQDLSWEPEASVSLASPRKELRDALDQTGTAGATGILVGYPFDTVKVRIQTGWMESHGIKYRGTFQCLSTIIKQEGFQSLYRGISSPLAGVTVMNAILFGVYGNVNRRLENPSSIKSIGIAGMAAGLVMSFICSPMELVKTQMQVHSECVSSLQTLKNIVRTNHFRGLFRGLGLTIAREVPGNALYFTSYEVMVRGQENNTAWVFAAGGLSGIFSWIFTYPTDVIKSRIQADLLCPDKRMYKSAWHCLASSVSAEGHAVLVRGIGSTIVRAFPVNATTMGVVTLIMKTFAPDEMATPHHYMTRLWMAESLHVELPPSVENYFVHIKYRPNVATLATDGPAIIRITRPDLAIAPQRLFMENMLAAMPTRYAARDAKDPDIGTFRAPLSLSALLRILTKMMGPKRPESGDVADFFDMQRCISAYGDMVIYNYNVYTVVQDEGDAAKEEEELMPPSLLQKPNMNEAQNEVMKSRVTTEDLLQPALLLSSQEDKIYGFYYLVS